MNYLSNSGKWTRFLPKILEKNLTFYNDYFFTIFSMYVCMDVCMSVYMCLCGDGICTHVFTSKNVLNNYFTKIKIIKTIQTYIILKFSFFIKIIAFLFLKIDQCCILTTNILLKLLQLVWNAFYCQKLYFRVNSAMHFMHNIFVHKIIIFYLKKYILKYYKKKQI